MFGFTEDTSPHEEAVRTHSKPKSAKFKVEKRELLAAEDDSLNHLIIFKSSLPFTAKRPYKLNTFYCGDIQFDLYLHNNYALSDAQKESLGKLIAKEGRIIQKSSYVTINLGLSTNPQVLGVV